MLTSFSCSLKMISEQHELLLTLRNEDTSLSPHKHFCIITRVLLSYLTPLVLQLLTLDCSDDVKAKDNPYYGIELLCFNTVYIAALLPFSVSQSLLLFFAAGVSVVLIILSLT